MHKHRRHSCESTFQAFFEPQHHLSQNRSRIPQALLVLWHRAKPASGPGSRKDTETLGIFQDALPTRDRGSRAAPPPGGSPEPHPNIVLRVLSKPQKHSSQIFSQIPSSSLSFLLSVCPDLDVSPLPESVCSRVGKLGHGILTRGELRQG